jgi:precorrin-3B synthase
METADGWLLRMRLPGGTIAPDQFDAVADTSERWGRGIVEITARGNLQLRGVAAEAVALAADALVHAGLADPEPVLDARRAVVAPPLTGHDPAEARSVAGLTEVLVDALVAAALPGPLAPKFGVVLDTTGSIRVGAVPGDLLLVARPAAGATEWWAAIGHGGQPGWSGVLGPCTDAELVRLTVDLAARCAAHGCRAADLPPATVAAVSGHRPYAPVGRATSPAAASVGPWDHVAPDRVSVVGAPPLGRLGPDGLRRLAGAGRRGLGLRVTPTGCVAVLGVRRHDLDLVTAELHGAGCSTDPLDGWHAVSACAGADGCASGRADTLAAATLVARCSAPDGRRPRVHLSGCEKRCGAPGDARILVADEAGRFVGDEEAP